LTIIPQPPDVFADPFILCTQCQERVTNTKYPGGINVPCGHVAGWASVCPSWSPVDGCTCTAPHETASPTP
jgi:hypothetical protein